VVMERELGRISFLFRHPVKSMAAERPDAATLGWHGVEGDRRFALRRLADHGGFPWLTASRLPELLLYQPFGRQANNTEPLPSHIRTPDGKEFEVTDEALEKDISRRCGSDVQLMHLSHGIFDDASVSIIALSTIGGIEREFGRDIDIRRFRPNIVLDTGFLRPFEEDAWVGKVLEFGDGNGPMIHVTKRDKRCVMLNLDPDTAAASPALMKTVVRMNENHAGVYGAVVRTGELCVGQLVKLRE
jgi:MOSC domain-containing protein